MSTIVTITALLGMVFLIMRMYYPLFWVNTTHLDNYLEMKYTSSLILIVAVSALTITGVPVPNGVGELYLMVIIPFYTTVIAGVLLGGFRDNISYWEVGSFAILPVLLPLRHPPTFGVLVFANALFITHCYASQEPLPYKRRVWISALLVYLFGFANYYHLFVMDNRPARLNVVLAFLSLFAALAFGHRSVLAGILNPKDIPRGPKHD